MQPSSATHARRLSRTSPATVSVDKPERLRQFEFPIAEHGKRHAQPPSHFLLVRRVLRAEAVDRTS